MAGDLIYAFRVLRLPLVDNNGAPIGRLDDIVLSAPHGAEAPRVLGFVAASQRRRIFVSAARVIEVDADGARLRSGVVDLRQFQLRPGEILIAGDLLDRRVGAEVVNDVALRDCSAGRAYRWEVARVVLRRQHPLRRHRTLRVVDWEEVRGLFETSQDAAEVARLRELHPSDVAAIVRSLPIDRRRRLAEVMEDERLADLLEELPETEQLRLLEGLDLTRVAHVIEEMEADDAVDLLAEMPGEQRSSILDAIDPEWADDLRRLLTYDEASAGGLMTVDPLIATPTTTVAETLARLRNPELTTTIAAQVFVCQPPSQTPTGTYLGTVGFQRLLRERPAMELGQCIEGEPFFVTPDLPDREVAERLASYNLLAMAVCDEQRRMVGAVTVDDVLDRVLPVGWRARQRRRVT